jgi:integrase
MFNKSIKEKFLNMYTNEDSKSAYARILNKSEPTEKALNKDLYDFTKEEIEDFLTDLAPLTIAISRSNGSVVASYIDWCINSGYKKSTINPLKMMDYEWFDKFVDKSVQIYFTEREITDIEQSCHNAQDAVIIRLYFEGVSGKDSCEIRFLHKNDVDFNNNVLRLRNEYGVISREITVEEKTIKLIREALGQKTYYKRNGQMEVHEKVKEYTDLVDNGYVLRNSITKTANYNGEVQSSVIYRRLKTISETSGIPFFTGKNILRSGVIYHAKDLLHDGHFDYDKFAPIAKRYGINNIYSIKSYCNEEIVNDLYGKTEAQSRTS